MFQSAYIFHIVHLNMWARLDQKEAVGKTLLKGEADVVQNAEEPELRRNFYTNFLSQHTFIRTIDGIFLISSVLCSHMLF